MLVEDGAGKVNGGVLVGSLKQVLAGGHKNGGVEWWSLALAHVLCALRLRVPDSGRGAARGPVIGRRVAPAVAKLLARQAPCLRRYGIPRKGFCAVTSLGGLDCYFPSFFLVTFRGGWREGDGWRDERAQLDYRDVDFDSVEPQ